MRIHSYPYLAKEQRNTAHDRLCGKLGHMKKVNIAYTLRKILNRNELVAVIAARGSKTPPEYLEELIGHENYYVRLAVAKNKRTPKEVTDYLSNHPDGEMRKLVSYSPNATADQLEDLRGELKGVFCEITLSVIGGNKNTSPETLRVLSSETYTNTRVAVARNPNTPIDVLMELSESRNDLVRASAAINPTLPLARLKNLIHDKKAIVRRTALKNPNAPINALEMCLKDRRETVRDSAARMLLKRQRVHKRSTKS